MEVDEPAAAEGEAAEVDAELYAALARVRRLGAMKAKERSEDFAAQRVATQLEAAGQWREEQEGSVELSALEFSETGEVRMPHACGGREGGEGGRGRARCEA